MTTTTVNLAAGLACADTCLVPVQAAFLSVKGLQALIKTIYTVKRNQRCRGQKCRF